MPALAPHELNRFDLSHAPTVNTQATISAAAVSTTGVNVCTDVTVTLAQDATGGTATNLTAALIDGASGGTTYLWRSTISVPSTAGSNTTIAISFPHGKKGSANTAMTLELSATGNAHTIQSVALGGYKEL